MLGHESHHRRIPAWRRGPQPPHHFIDGEFLIAGWSLLAVLIRVPDPPRACRVSLRRGSEFLYFFACSCHKIDLVVPTLLRSRTTLKHKDLASFLGHRAKADTRFAFDSVTESQCWIVSDHLCKYCERVAGKFRLGLIGTGRHGGRYANHIIRDLPEVELAAIARRNPAEAERQAQEYNCRAYTDFRELVAARDVDAVVAVVPPTVHKAIVEAAAAERKPLLLEKPAAPNVAEGMEILTTARRAGITVMVAQTLRYNGVVRCILEHLPEIGPVHSMRLGQRFEPSRPGWIDDPAVAGGGMLLHTGVHCFDLVRYLLKQEVARVACEWSRVNVRRTEDNFAAVLRLQDDRTLATIAGSRATGSRSGGIELAGEHGQLIGDHVLHSAVLVRGTETRNLELPPPVPTVREVLRDFVRAVRSGALVPIPLEEGLRAVAIVEACYRSAAEQCTVPVPALSYKI
ncbi:MAG: Gfo/Idh/MocA family oxidoreductase [Candidatus Binatia bacterium]|nr:Gfo/Idh/MocA family oxidoreductase [Candidatus Binatia bacterium]